MIKRLAYIILLLIFATGLTSAKITAGHYALVTGHALRSVLITPIQKDTVNAKKHQQEEDKKKIKEISKAKRQSKPEKIGEDDNEAQKDKRKKQRRPEGLERPPEIPRRNGN